MAEVALAALRVVGLSGFAAAPHCAKSLFSCRLDSHRVW